MFKEFRVDDWAGFINPRDGVKRALLEKVYLYLGNANTTTEIGLFLEGFVAAMEHPFNIYLSTDICQEEAKRAIQRSLILISFLKNGDVHIKLPQQE
jgi:hypothetical protein